MFVVLTKFGNNCNKRYYFGFLKGSVPGLEWKPHLLYPWYKRWKISFSKNMCDIF